MGGEARLTRQRERGRLNARERIAALFDPGSFSEIGQLVGTTEDPPVPGDALVAGSGRIEGRPALAGAEDVTVLGGSIGSGASDKRYRLCQLALQERVPLVMMLEGAGHRVTDSCGGTAPRGPDGPGRALGRRAHGLPRAGRLGGPRRPDRAAVRLRRDDRIGLDLRRRPAAGEVGDGRGGDQGGARRPAGGGRRGRGRAQRRRRRRRSHRAGPALPRLLPAQCVGAAAASRRTRHRAAPAGDHPRPDPARSPGRPYPIGPVLDTLVDEGSLLEIQPTFGRSIVTALARLGGQSVAIVANDPSVMAGTIDSAAADKVAHFLDVVGAFGLPVRLPGRQPRRARGHGRRAAGDPAPCRPACSPCSID